MNLSDETTEKVLDAVLGFVVGYLVFIAAKAMVDEFLQAYDYIERQRMRSVILDLLEEQRARQATPAAAAQV
jgi:hypothetical protein